MSTQEDHSDDIALAGEYVLRLLDDVERRAFEARMANDAHLRDLVRDWESQLAPLADDIAPVTPPAAVKARLQTVLFPDAKPRRGKLWAWVSGGLVAASLVVGALLLGPLLDPDIGTAPTFVASVSAEDGSLVVLASFVAETNTLELSREAGAALPGRVLELWLIAEGAEAPVSLGVLLETPTTRIDVPQTLAGQMAGGALAISDEPPGGSPTGAPTGAVLAVGPITDA
ncbi:anti-sigma factor [Fluviibacterium sp. S390]|uniref:anti-sigma factor n=1 Tax=Fluviibacterium sp. S390 TaxID=3415139 RepID=UPI003C7D8904